MRTYAKLAITALVAAAALSALVGSASANRLSITNRNVRVTWSSLELIGAGRTIRCAVTLEGTFHENTIAKTVGGLIGYITAARVRRPCTNGTAWVYNGSEVNETLGNSVLPNSLPWHITYAGFNERLPEIERVRIELSLARFLVRATILGLPALCPFRTSTERGLGRGEARVEGGGGVTQLRASGSIVSENEVCGSGQFASQEGDGRVTLLGTTNAVSIRLI